MEAVILRIAVHAELLPSGQTNPVGSCHFPTALAHVRIEDSGRFRERNYGFLYKKELLCRECQIAVQRFFSRSLPFRLLKKQTNRFAGLAVIEGKCLLACHVKQEIAFSDAAAQHRLDGVAAAGIIFGNADGFLVL